MNRTLATLAATVMLGSSAAMAQFPPVPDHAFNGMPEGIARQLRQDMARVNQDLQRMMAGQPILPPVDDFALPVEPGVGRRHCEQSHFSCVNGAFQLRHRVNGVAYRVTGTMHGGPACVEKIVIDEAGQCREFARLEDLPLPHRSLIRDLLRSHESIEE